MSAIGIDMSKRSFHVAFPNDRVVVYPNTETGFISFIDTIQKYQPVLEQTKIGVESTGTYHLPLCVFLTKQGHPITVLNPLTVSRVAATRLRTVKTDHLDAKIIRSVTESGAGYVFSDSEDILKLKALVKERSSLAQVRAGMKQRLESEHYRGEAAMGGYSKILAVVSQEIKKVERRLLTYDRPTQTLLRSIPGVGLASAVTLLAVVGDIKRFSNAKKLTAYIGLDCRVKESGTSVHGKGFLTKRGNKQLRCVLFNATLVAKRYIPELQTFYQKKKSEGHHHFSALCATERKLVHIIYAVWKRGAPFVRR